MDSLEKEESGGNNEIVMKNYQVLNRITGNNDTSDDSLLLSSYHVADTFQCISNINSLNPHKNFTSRHDFYFHFTLEETEAQGG